VNVYRYDIQVIQYTYCTGTVHKYNIQHYIHIYCIQIHTYCTVYVQYTYILYNTHSTMHIEA
jgi:hypothetical protein